jgi:hypothetical protein
VLSRTASASPAAPRTAPRRIEERRSSCCRASSPAALLQRRSDAARQPAPRTCSTCSATVCAANPSARAANDGSCALVTGISSGAAPIRSSVAVAARVRAARSARRPVRIGSSESPVSSPVAHRSSSTPATSITVSISPRHGCPVTSAAATSAATPASQSSWSTRTASARSVSPAPPGRYGVAANSFRNCLAAVAASAARSPTGADCASATSSAPSARQLAAARTRSGTGACRGRSSIPAGTENATASPHPASRHGSSDQGTGMDTGSTKVSSVAVVAPAAYEPSEAAIRTTKPTIAIPGTAVHTDIEQAVASVIDTVPMPATTA